MYLYVHMALSHFIKPSRAVINDLGQWFNIQWLCSWVWFHNQCISVVIRHRTHSYFLHKTFFKHFFFFLGAGSLGLFSTLPSWEFSIQTKYDSIFRVLILYLIFSSCKEVSPQSLENMCLTFLKCKTDF